MLYSKGLTKIIYPILIGIGLLFIPLVRDLHMESAILVSLVGCFWGGIRAVNKTAENDFNTAIKIVGKLLIVGLPLLLNAVITGCFSIHGVAFWLLFPLPSVFFGYAIGRLVRSFTLPNAKAITVGILLFIGVGILLIELLSYPQVYFFNHVWGGWPGPIYDEVVRVNEATIFFRILTLLWVVLMWYIPDLNKDGYAKWVVGISAVVILISYTQLTEFSVNSPRSYLQNVLGGHQSTEHFELYYDNDRYSDYEIDLLAKEHEFYFDHIANRLDLPVRDSANKIESYLYGHPWQKKQLVGAKFTSYVPVWLKKDQLHIAKQQIQSSLKHELVHVMAKQFGNWFNASWNIGLIEGIAVAIDGGSSATSTVHQIVVSEKPYPSARELERAFSFWGFYGGRSGVNYTTSGSFVHYLMEHYPIALLKQAYRTGSVQQAYQTDWESLANEWHTMLDTIEVDSIDQQVASRLFGMQSLFEKECPHVVSDFAAAYDNYRFALANHDTTEALKFLEEALIEADSAEPIKTEWSYRNLIEGHSENVRQAATLKDTTVDLQLLYADAFALSDRWKEAELHLSKGQKLFAKDPDSLLKPALETRNDRRQWKIYRQMTYDSILPDSVAFNKALHRTMVRSIRKAMEQERWDKMKLYAGRLLEKSLKQKYFDDYKRLVHHLAFQDNVDLAKQFVRRLQELPLRNRYRERLQQEWEWIQFLETERGAGNYD